MPRLDFLPDRDGLHFANRFTNHIGPFTSAGRCGGMVYTALDYYLSRLPVPTHVAADYGPAGVPADGTRLADYILRRQVASISNVSASRFLTWHGFWTSDRDRVSASTHHEFDHLRQRIDSQQPTPLGLVSRSGVTDSHQVLAYGYDHDTQGRALAVIWDNNQPDTECVLRASADGKSIQEFDLGVDATMTGTPLETWRGYFVHDAYALQAPHRPDYLDLTVATAMHIAAGTATYTVRNAGDVAAHANGFGATTLAADNHPVGGRFGADTAGAIDLAPGAEQTVSVAVAGFAFGAGLNTVVAAAQTRQQHWLTLPDPRQPAGNSAVVTVG